MGEQIELNKNKRDPILEQEKKERRMNEDQIENLLKDSNLIKTLIKELDLIQVKREGIDSDQATIMVMAYGGKKTPFSAAIGIEGLEQTISALGEYDAESKSMKDVIFKDESTGKEYFKYF